MYSEFPRGGYNIQHFLKLFDHITFYPLLRYFKNSKSAKKRKKNSKSKMDIQIGTQMPVKIPWAAWPVDHV